MVLVNTKEMIKKAKEGHYAVGSFNVTDNRWCSGEGKLTGDYPVC